VTAIRVLVADDHAVLRAGLKLLIGAHADMKVVGEAATGPEAVQAARAASPDVVLLDLSMPGGRYSQTIEALARLEPAPRVLVLTMHDDPVYMRAALQAGASGYIVKKAADVELVTAIRAVHQGRTFVDLSRPGEPPVDQGQRQVRRVSPADGLPRVLSPRETEVLRLLAQGHTNQGAAEVLHVSVKTVETHRQRLIDKLGLKTRAQLYRFAVEAGLMAGEGAPPPE
jgi:two-component system response regulator NreC